MKMRDLGNSGLQVSEICLGTMTWGTQNTEAEGHAQMDQAVAAGVNFFDTAAMYPTTPASAETQGRTEEIIGTWFASGRPRDKIILATKVAGEGLKWIHNGDPITDKKIRLSVEESLTRLQTDYIDLYQLHWPNRGSYHFRQSWSYDPTGQNTEEVQANFLEVLHTLQSLIDEGKIRHWGLSNESCWGTSQYLSLADANGLTRPVSIQNEYNLLYRTYDLDLAELSHHENIGLLAYSPLAAGMLTGKYNDGQIPEGSRRSLNNNLFGRYNPHSVKAVAAYQALADKHGLDLTQMAIAFCLTRPFMASAIIGATSPEQLQTCLTAAELTLSDEVLADILDVYKAFTMPI
ncbi:aldo/keto reductase [Granulosicoccaceae sp. 1_MG-2023]|nr:aldo/keto reductase [Granulosicoccaceae sp. 1_MG-2023]